MQRRTLGKTGLQVSPICIGAWQLGGPLFFNGRPDGHPDPGHDQVLALIRALGELGVNFIDTAEQYSGGESERRVGEALLGQRDRWVISTKFGYRVGAGGERVDDASPATIRPSLEGSLRRLRTDRIDVYLYHCAPRVEELDAAREVLEQLRSEGKIRWFGLSGNDLALMKEMAARDLLHVIQFHAHLLQEAPHLRDFARERGLGTQVRGVMAQGRLSGKYFHAAPAWRADDRRSAEQRPDYHRYAALEEFVPPGYTMAQVALRWILDDPAHHSVCLGAKNLEDYRVSLRALDLPPLTAGQRERLSACAARLALEDKR